MKGVSPRRLAIVAVVLVAFAPLINPPNSSGALAASSGIPLPRPLRNVDPLANPAFGLTLDRLKRSITPGSVADHEVVTVAAGPTGAAASVTDLQQLDLIGVGDYAIRERGPAREVASLGSSVPPKDELGTVVWEGFSTGHRQLAALLTLDPGIEAHRLPMAVGLAFHDRSGHGRALLPGATAPTDGVVTLTLSNQTATTVTVPVGSASARTVAAVLDQLRAVAAHPHPAVPPTAGAGLPATLPGSLLGETATTATAALQVSGQISVPGAAADPVSGPGLTAGPDGASVLGLLDATVSFDISLRRGQRLTYRLAVLPWLDPRVIGPPIPFASWQSWERHGPSAAAVSNATTTLVSAVADAARAAEYSPYLQADTNGPALATFTYVVEPPTAVSKERPSISAKPGAMTAAGLALIAIIGNALLLRRRL
jgi:hypothetical protein